MLNDFIFSEKLSAKRILNFDCWIFFPNLLQNVGEEVVFISVHDASQVESLLYVPVVEELVFGVHVEGRSDLVNVVSESFSDGDRSSYRNEHLEIVVISKLIR